ncbi:threonine/serine ThrE exporter family protein [Petrocella sp. FN5]|uniref:threonine/serine ThrE exporter family protein n=1 Tax=Petrocella sp. FN5 TaxID=3032002 RepID=UPI0023D98591|nr:threonine/serine exporter family protein [Petrocella sp. FN5]MDF1617781.1 threonine/serine exporter family protein [Petrocella sp. FN5]
MDSKKLMNFSLTVGEVMLKNGAETYRVEDTINRILKTSNYKGIESFVTPTGIFATLEDEDRDHMTFIRRVNNRDINLYRIELANAISRDYCNRSITLNDAYDSILKAAHVPTYSKGFIVISVGLAAGLFAIVLGGSVYDAFVTFVAGLVLGLFQVTMQHLGVSKFFIDIIGSFMTSWVALFFIHALDFGTSLDLIIISSIMPLVPGVAITNAVRDTIHGDLVSGASRILDAFIIAASIAAGVGIALSIFNSIYGGILL